MNPFEHEEQFSAYVCDFAEEPPFVCLKYVLENELQVARIDNFWRVGGSQEISLEKYRIDDEIVTVQEETFVGITLFGTQKVVENIMARVRNRLEKSNPQLTNPERERRAQRGSLMSFLG